MRRMAILVAVGTLTVGCGSNDKIDATSIDTAANAAAAKIDPHNFSANVTNPWFPLKRGTTLRYVGKEDGEPAVDIVKVSNRVERIAGVPCVVIEDRAYVNGRLEESTIDWYSQDRTGTVWYFGENTRTIDRNGRTKSREGSWRHGVNGAKAGIFMPPRPHVGQGFRQEYYKGHAEDHFRVVSTTGSVKVRYGSWSGNVLVTEEWTPLEPGVREHKYWVRGIGKVKEGDLELASVKRS